MHASPSWSLVPAQSGRSPRGARNVPVSLGASLESPSKGNVKGGFLETRPEVYLGASGRRQEMIIHGQSCPCCAGLVSPMKNLVLSEENRSVQVNPSITDEGSRRKRVRIFTATMDFNTKLGGKSTIDLENACGGMKYAQIPGRNIVGSRTIPVTTIRKQLLHNLNIDWKSIPGFWQSIIQQKVMTSQSSQAEEEEILSVADHSKWFSSKEVYRQFKLKVQELIHHHIAFVYYHDRREYFWDPSGVRALALYRSRQSQLRSFELFAERMSKMDFLLRENGVDDFEKLFLTSPLITAACRDFVDPSVAKPKTSQLAALKNIIGLSEITQAFPSKYLKSSLLRQYVAEKVFIVDKDGLLIDKRIRDKKEALRFVLAHLSRSKLVENALLAAATPIAELLGDSSNLILALEMDSNEVATMFTSIQSRAAVERLILGRVGKHLQLDRDRVWDRIRERRVELGVQRFVDLATKTPCNKNVGIDFAVKEIHFLLTTSIQRRSEVLMDYLNETFDNVDEQEMLFERFPFLKEYADGVFGGGLSECETCVPVAMALNEMDAYDKYFQGFRENLRGKVSRGYSWQRALKSVMRMKMARGMPVSLGDIYSSL